MFLFFFSFRKKWKDKYFFLGTAFAYIFFHAFTTVRGAYSPAGRPLMFVSWIFILFIAHYYFNLMKADEKNGNGANITARLLSGLSIFILIWLFYYPLFVYQPVFAGTTERASGLNLFLGGSEIELWKLFPSFLTSPESPHPANYIWIGAILFLIAVNYRKGLKQDINPSQMKLRRVAVFALFPLLVLLYCVFPHVHLINKNKYNGNLISFYNNSKNFRALPEQNTFRIKAGNSYDIFIDRKMVNQDELTLHFNHTDTARVILKNGKTILFDSNDQAGNKTESMAIFRLRVSSLESFEVDNQTVSHIGFETETSMKNAYLNLEIK
jgi:hypothetical protein